MWIYTSLSDNGYVNKIVMLGEVCEVGRRV